MALSAISVVELSHGIYRQPSRKLSGREDASSPMSIFNGMRVHPVSLEVAELAGQIEGELAERGVSIAMEDLLIGATALSIGFGVATLNLRHFQLIPGLSVPRATDTPRDSDSST